MMLATAGAFGSTEGWLSLEAHESDLRGSRGVAVAGLLKCYMGICNFKTTVSLACLRSDFSIKHVGTCTLIDLTRSWAATILVRV